MCLITLSVLSFTAKPVLAASEGDLGAFPTKYDPSNPKTRSWFIYELPPGESKEDSITVVNNSDRAIDVKIYPVDATTTSDGAFALFNENQVQSEIGKWVTLAKNTFTIAPRDRQTIPFTITIPKYTTVGDHAGGIIIQEIKKTENTTKGINLNIVSRVGTRIYETVPGDKIWNLDLQDLTYKIIDDRLLFTFKLENKGNVILTPTGKLQVKDQFGKIIDVISLNNLGSAFPGNATVISVKSDKTAPLFGQYTAAVTINYSNTKAIEKSIQFFIFIRDWKLALPVPGVLFAIAIFFIFRKSFRKSHRVMYSPQTPVPAYEPTPVIIDTRRPAYAPVPAVSIDQLFITRHIRLIAATVFIGTITVSSLFAILLNIFIMSNKTTFTTSAYFIEPSNPPLRQAPTTPTPTNTPIDRSKINITVLNGGGKTGAASAIADKLTKEGFTIDKIGNAPINSTQTLIQYPKNRLKEADELMPVLQNDYTDIRKEEISDSSTFTVILGL